MEQEYQIFISYRHNKTKDYEKLFHEKLCALGYTVFLDHESLHSGKFEPQILEHLENCICFLLLLPDTEMERLNLENDWVRKEIRLALEHNDKIHIIPVLIGDIKWEQIKLPEDINELREYQTVAADDNDQDETLRRICKMLTCNPIARELPLIPCCVRGAGTRAFDLKLLLYGLSGLPALAAASLCGYAVFTEKYLSWPPGALHPSDHIAVMLALLAIMLILLMYFAGIVKKFIFFARIREKYKKKITRRIFRNTAIPDEQLDEPYKKVKKTSQKQLQQNNDIIFADANLPNNLLEDYFYQNDHTLLGTSDNTHITLYQLAPRLCSSFGNSTFYLLFVGMTEDNVRKALKKNGFILKDSKNGYQIWKHAEMTDFGFRDKIRKRITVQVKYEKQILFEENVLSFYTVLQEYFLD